MKRVILLCLTLCLFLNGCSWLDGEYHSVTPHASDNTAQPQSGITVSSYAELRDALSDMVNAGVQENTFYLGSIDREKIDQYMNTAIMHVRTSTAIGAYAVEQILYESGTVAELNAVAVDVTYLHGRQEILRIKKAQAMDNFKGFVVGALISCDPNVVVMVDRYEKLDVVQFVQDYVDENPQVCMEMPQVAVTTYPETGEERIVEISFTYQTSRDLLRAMQENVMPIFSAARMYVEGTEGDLQKYEQLYSFLMERFDYTFETSITPTYSLLRYGVGDSKAFASVYRVMCENAGIPCDVISGTRDGEAWYWNHIKIEDSYYHVDLLASSQVGEFTTLPSDEMAGYVWDYSVYP